MYGGMPPAPVAPISPEQLRALVEASRRAKKLRRCTSVARFGGWTCGIFGAITLAALPLAFSWAGLFIGAGLCAAAYGEFHGAALVRALDARGPRRLAMNQIVLAAVLVTYSLWSLYDGLRGGSLGMAASGNPEVDAMVAGLTRTLSVAVYGTFAALGLIAPGLTAWYYASRARYIEDVRCNTDSSVIEALKAA